MSRSLLATAKVGALLVLVLAATLLSGLAGFGPEPASANPLPEVATVAAAGNHTCAVTTAGGVKCWGWNQFRQLGNGTTTSSTTPVDVCADATCTNNLSGVTAISLDARRSCAMTTAGGVKCWGSNGSYELGDGTNTKHSTPVDVCADATCTTDLSGVTAITVGNFHTCALTATGGVKCWGAHASGALGDGTTTGGTTPVDVCGDATCTTNLSGVTAIAAGGDGVGGYTCAVTTAGGVKCWGYNFYGNLGDGTTGTSRTTPVDVCADATCTTNLSGIATVEAAQNHTCAMTTAGGVKCWGRNDLGSLGDGNSPNDSSTPVDVCADATCTTNLSGVAAVTAAGLQTCALTTVGSLKCWGYNFNGQLGDGTTSNRSAPVNVVGLGSITSAAAGGSLGQAQHTCAVTTAGGVKCWGHNGQGALGDGTTNNSTTPVDVVVDVPKTSGDADGDGVPDDFEDGFGGEDIKITNSDSIPPDSATVTGDAASGSTITSGNLTIELPPGTLAISPTTEIEIVYVADGPGPGVNPKIEISGVSLPGTSTKTVEMPFGDQDAVCIDDSPTAEIETIDVGGCSSPRVEIAIPADGGTNTSGVYSVSRTGTTIRIEGLSHTAIGTITAPPPPVGGIALDADAGLQPLDTASSERDLSAFAWAIVAAAGVAALGGAAWYTRRRLAR